MHLFHEGEFIGPFVYKTKFPLGHGDTLKRVYSDTGHVDLVQPGTIFLLSAIHVRILGLFSEAGLHFDLPTGGRHAVPSGGPTGWGATCLSRIIYGGRISLTVGLIGISISFLLGLFFGGVSGYFGGWWDTLTQRLIEIIRSFPELPLWMALSAALPVTWSPTLIYFGITIILGLIDWTGLARAVRGKILALREEDFATAAQLMGASSSRIVGRHLIPSFMSHLIASATLSIPSMILGETALSFLGLGLRPPITSWGVLLNEAQNINVVALYPWLMLPVVPVIIVVLTLNFFGDGLRDAADPYR